MIKKRRRAILIRLSILFVAVLVLFVGAFFTLRANFIKIDQFNVKNGAFADEKEVKSLVSEVLSKNYLMIFPRNNIFLFPKNEIKNLMLNKFPEINNIEISYESLKSVTINFSERKTFGTWCSGMRDSSNDCYFLDETGYVFSKAPNTSGDVYFKYYGSITDNPISKYYLPLESFNKINKLINLIKDFNEKIKPVAISSGIEKDFILYLSDGSRVFFQEKQDPDILAKNFKTVANELMTEFKSKDLGKVDYIDLRFGNKTTYTLRQKSL
ncbi:hypothetical protein IT397_03230 [Candidatus Nomurabacteria bacterium]|nr:hypothetical protein [Candidatus Nomurabacteria bacterium]